MICTCFVVFICITVYICFICCFVIMRKTETINVYINNKIPTLFYLWVMMTDFIDFQSSHISNRWLNRRIDGKQQFLVFTKKLLTQLRIVVFHRWVGWVSGLIYEMIVNHWVQSSLPINKHGWNFCYLYTRWLFLFFS